MRFSSIRFLVKQGLKNMGANRLMTFAGVGVLTACFIITGIAALLTININAMVQYLSGQNEIVVFMKPEVDDDAAEVLLPDIKGNWNVSEVEMVGKAAAYLEAQEMLSAFSDNLLAGYDDIFPIKFNVTVKDLAHLDETDGYLNQLEGVEYTVKPVALADVMLTVRDAVTYGGWGIVVVLAVVSMIVISNTIRLTVFARRREISIMKYVGATNTFIRLPFFVEGVAVGVIAGLLSGGVLCGAYTLVYGYLQEMVNVWVLRIMSSVLRLSDIWGGIMGLAVLAGAVLGGLGTAFSVRKHLKV